jgi:lectin, mannose-binding 2
MQREDKVENKKKSGFFSKNRATTGESTGSWSGFFFKALLFAGVCAGGWYGYKEYQRRQMYGGGLGGLGRGGGYGGGMYSSNKRAF